MISRRSLLVASAALPACALDAQESESMVTPWHLWGSSQSVTLSFQLASSARQQLAQVRYGRPDNWQFMLAARLLGGQSTAAVQVVVQYDLTIGVGRSVMTLPNWHHFTFNVPIGPIAPVQKWVSQVQPPIVDDSKPAVITAPCSAITAETVIIEATVFSTFGFVNDICQVQFDAQLSPSTHVRPEWYSGKFPGREDHGT